MARAEGLTHCRLIAVGLFLSLITIPSKQLVNYMRNVWKIRGSLESNELADKRFVLEFSEEGDYEHVTRGGPWRYQNDAVLIRPLKEGEDPATIPFDNVPIWVQFAGLPYYLLSKELTRELGKKLGELISIDNNARGDLCDKIIRARIKLPIARALQRWITLEDEVSNKEVVISVLYERLPTFCLCCGVIGHSEPSCNLPPALRRRRYSPAIGVQPTHIDDPRCWYLPATSGQNRRAIQLAQPWRAIDTHAVRYAPPESPQYALVANVAKEVAKLSVREEGARPGDRGDKERGDKDGAAPSPATSVASKPASPPQALVQAQEAKVAGANNNTATDDTAAIDKIVINTTAVCTDAVLKAADDALLLVGKLKKWKRQVREGEEVQSKPKADPKGKDDDAKNSSKLGKRQEEQGTELMLIDEHGELTKTKKHKMNNTVFQEEGKMGTVDGTEATSPGAAGQLTGASVSACQEP